MRITGEEFLAQVKKTFFLALLQDGLDNSIFRLRYLRIRRIAIYDLLIGL